MAVLGGCLNAGDDGGDERSHCGSAGLLTSPSSIPAHTPSTTYGEELHKFPDQSEVCVCVCVGVCVCVCVPSVTRGDASGTLPTRSHFCFAFFLSFFLSLSLSFSLYLFLHLSYLLYLYLSLSRSLYPFL